MMGRLSQWNWRLSSVAVAVAEAIFTSGKHGVRMLKPIAETKRGEREGWISCWEKFDCN